MLLTYVVSSFQLHALAEKEYLTTAKKNTGVEQCQIYKKH